MVVSDLIKRLQKLPQDKNVSVFWDGGARGGIEGIVNSKEVVIVGDWSIYRDGSYREYPENEIVFG